MLVFSWNGSCVIFTLRFLFHTAPLECTWMFDNVWSQTGSKSKRFPTILTYVHSTMLVHLVVVIKRNFPLKSLETNRAGKRLRIWNKNTSVKVKPPFQHVFLTLNKSLWDTTAQLPGGHVLTNQHGLKESDRGSPKDHFYKIIWKTSLHIRRRFFKFPL